MVVVGGVVGTILSMECVLVIMLTILSLHNLPDGKFVVNECDASIDQMSVTMTTEIILIIIIKVHSTRLIVCIVSMNCEILKGYRCMYGPIGTVSLPSHA